jgi:hypothetical protein
MPSPLLRIYALLVLLHGGCLGLSAQQLGTQASVTMLTGAPGDQLYTIFGHSAIRIQDPAKDLDIVFNYGTFDFQTPNFYLKFLRGKLNYRLSIEEYKNFEYGYHYYGQDVYEQKLSLDSAQKQAVYDFLLWNHQPENRYYKYDFFYDNCATRIRDLFQIVLKDALRFDFPQTWREDPRTFRQLLDHYLMDHPWYDLGIDIILGLPADKKALPSDYMFLPYFMEIAFDNGKIRTENQWTDFVFEKQQVVKTDNTKSVSTWFTPTLAGWLFFIVVISITLVEWFKKSPMRIIDVVLFGTVGLIGWLIVFLWFFTDHIATKSNLNILWAIPFHFPLVFFLGTSSLRPFIRIYLVVSLVLVIMTLSFWNILPQQFHGALMPVLLVLGFRLLFMLDRKNS